MSADSVDIGRLDLENTSSPRSDDVHNDETMFAFPYHLYAEQAASLDKTYVLDIAVQQCGENRKTAVALSNNSSTIFDLNCNQFNHLTTLTGHTGPISNLKFSPKSENILYSGSLDGTIKIWDLRTSEYVKEMKDTKSLKPITCFDISCNERFICAGTELIDGDAFIIFWDIRSRKLLGGYWESHTDDLTQIQFHPYTPDLVATSSTDGLINIFDISQNCETDALQHSLNAESSVLKIKWHKVQNNYNHLSCIRDTETVQLWNIDDGGPYLQFSRETISEGIGKQADDCYIIDVHQKLDEELFILAGSTAGKSECLKTLCIKKKKLLPITEFVGNRQIVRASHYEPETGLLFTGGESGYISVWKAGESSDKNRSTLKKMGKSRNKHHKTKPY